MFKSKGHPSPNESYKNPQGPCEMRDQGPPMKAATGRKGPPQSPGAGYTQLNKAPKGGKMPPQGPAKRGA